MIEYKNKIPIQQVVFRKGRGTNENVIWIITYIQHALSQSKTSIAIFLDIKAHDRVNIQSSIKYYLKKDISTEYTT